MTERGLGGGGWVGLDGRPMNERKVGSGKMADTCKKARSDRKAKVKQAGRVGEGGQNWDASA